MRGPVQNMVLTQLSGLTFTCHVMAVQMPSTGVRNKHKNIASPFQGGKAPSYEL